MPITIDFSEFFSSKGSLNTLEDHKSDLDTLEVSVKDHFAYLQNEGLGEYEVVTFSRGRPTTTFSRDFSQATAPSTSDIITALRALIPAEGERNLQEVIFSYPCLDDSALRSPVRLNDSGGSLEIGCLHLGYTTSPHAPHLIPFLKSLSSVLKQKIAIREIVVDVISKISEESFINSIHSDKDVLQEPVGRIWLILSSGSDQPSVIYRLSDQGLYQVSNSDGPQCVLQPLPFSPPDSNNCHSTFVSKKCSFDSCVDHIRHSLKLSPQSKTLQYLKLEQIYGKGAKGSQVAIAVLSSGYDFDHLVLRQHVVEKRNFTNQYNPVHEAKSHYSPIGTNLSLAVVGIAPESKLIVCKTTFGRNGRYKAPSGATAKAIKWLRKKWSDKGWREEHGLHSLVVLIPYGGHYREDEMIAINEAIDDGIIVVCAAGETASLGAGQYLPGIAFPASMGNVLCVGAADEGGRPVLSSPSGREIDCLAPNQLEFRCVLDLNSCMYTLEGTGASASVLVGFVSLLLSYIHTTLQPDRPHVHVAIIREILKHTTRSGKHDPHAGYGMVMPYVFSFSQHRLRNLLNWEVLNPNFDWQLDKKQGKFNFEALSHLPLTGTATHKGKGVTVALVDGFLGELQGNHNPASTLVAKIKSKNEANHGVGCAITFVNVAPNADLSLHSYLPARGKKLSDMLAAKIKEIVSQENPPRIISCSLGYDHFNLGLAVAVNKAINAGIIPIFPVGNEGFTSSNAVSYPSRLGNVLCIGAHTSHGTYHTASSVGREVDFLAPGEIVLPGGFHAFGTSFAVPIVAGFVALILGYLQDIVKGNLKTPEGKPIAIDDKYKSISSWSKSESGEYKWKDIPIDVACHNVYVIRALLRQMSVYRTEHSDTAGYGNLDIRRLLNDLAPEDIHDIVQNFYKSQ